MASYFVGFCIGENAPLLLFDCELQIGIRSRPPSRMQDSCHYFGGEPLANFPGRVAGDDGEGGDVPRDYSAGTDDGADADTSAARQDQGVRPDPRVVLDHEGAWRRLVTTRSAKTLAVEERMHGEARRRVITPVAPHTACDRHVPTNVRAAGESIFVETPVAVGTNVEVMPLPHEVPGGVRKKFPTLEFESHVQNALHNAM